MDDIEETSKLWAKWKNQLLGGDIDKIKFLNKATGLNLSEYTSWESFGQLWTWSSKQDWFYAFLLHEFWDSNSKRDEIECIQSIVNSDTFANSIFDWLTDEEFIKKFSIWVS